MYIIHLKPDKTEALPERINEWGWGHKTRINLYIYHPINLHGGDFRSLTFE
jgi:hypothetical protein